MDLPVNYYRIGIEDRRLVREEYIKLQDGRCHHCGELLSENPPPSIRRKRIHKKYFPSAFFNHPVHLHHDHETGMTIGAVHCQCNAVLWEHHGE